MKKILLLLSMMLAVTGGMAQKTSVSNRVKADKDSARKSFNVRELVQDNVASPSREGDEIITTTLLTEDFSKFVAGSESEPDTVRLDHPETSEIDDALFNTPSWIGLEVYQAGGCALLKYSEEYGETGMLITPLLNTTGCVTIKCRMKSLNPDGDYVGYNIIDENAELVDYNYSYVTYDEWTDVEWLTTYGMENTYVFFFAYNTDVFIDDIEIANHYMPVPTLLPETDITDSSFTANWNPINGADEYNFFMYAEHTAKQDETFYIVDYNFDDIESYGTPESPEIPEEYTIDYGSWYAYLPVYINGSIGLSGEGADYGMYATFTSGEYDLSSDNGTVTISFKLKGTTGENVELYFYTASDDVYDGGTSELFTLQCDDWVEYTFTFTGGTKRSMFDLYYYGWNYLYIDDLKVSQNLKTGDSIEVLAYNVIHDESSVNVVVNNSFRADKLYYTLYGIKYFKVYDAYYDEYYVSGGIYSDFTEPRYVTLKGEEVASIEMASPAYAYFADEQLNIFNPENEMVSVYSVNGVCVYRGFKDGQLSLDVSKGAYIVRIGNKTMKVVNN